MSEENIELVKRAADAFKRLDFEAWKATASDQIALYPRREEPGVDERYDGWDGVLVYLGNWYSGWEKYEAEPLEFIDAGDYVIVDFRETGIAKGSGIRVEETFAHAFKVDDGKIVEWRMFGPVSEALAAVTPF